MAEVDRNQIRAGVAELLMHVDRPQVFDEELHGLLRSLGSEENVAGAARFIPGLGESYGVPVPALGLIAAELSKWGQHHVEEAFALVERLWHNGSRDERVIAAKMLERLGKREWEKTLEIATSFVGDIRNWEECDQLACFGLREVVQRHPEAVLPRCRDWVRSENKWARRFGVAVLTSLPKDKTYRPSGREFAILDVVMADEAQEVQDAVDWALREIGKRHPAPVADYLRRHAPHAERPTRRIIKRAMKVLPEEEQAALQALLER
ncbi:MAG: DNA alkylation repair protein [Anaerolineae bacterium]|jgi:3-methyladenine DNA glycosylase AlkD|nr:DNA alkylation repair protein [Anaerolineae bacterium]MDH7474774.1 DNA alkylation repair protein [Anaerolineae bacterium]